jgi:gamma-glutamyltranspeptidase/glutathione hydrolase
VVDAEGNAVALTTTVNLHFGAKLIAGSTGVVMNDQMDDFALAPGVANHFGLVGNAQNALAPRKRPLSSMTPTIVLGRLDGLDGDQVLVVVGGAGGSAIISGTLQALVHRLDFGLDAQAAVAAPRLHAQWIPDAVKLERDIPVDVRRALEARGHKVELTDPLSAVNMVARDPAGGWTAASDPRKLDGAAPAGY